MQKAKLWAMVLTAGLMMVFVWACAGSENAPRLELAAGGDFVIVLYNPKSKKRDWQLGAVRDLLLGHKDPGTPVGIVSRAAREGQATTVTTLEDLLTHPVDMQTIVIVGNSQTYTYGGYMITPRGYQEKYRGQVAGERQGSEIRGQGKI